VAKSVASTSARLVASSRAKADPDRCAGRVLSAFLVYVTHSPLAYIQCDAARACCGAETRGAGVGHTRRRRQGIRGVLAGVCERVSGLCRRMRDL
jgi:hypothetical protein